MKYIRETGQLGEKYGLDFFAIEFGKTWMEFLGGGYMWEIFVCSSCNYFVRFKGVSKYFLKHLIHTCAKLIKISPTFALFQRC